MSTLTLNPPAVYNLTLAMTERISITDFNKLKEGEVVLVRSKAVGQLADHFAVIVGPLVQKTTGMRPQVIVMESIHAWLLNVYEPDNPILLKLSPQARKAFFEHYDLTMSDGHVDTTGYTIQ